MSRANIDASHRETLAERDFLLTRLASDHYHHGNWIGMSSNAMLLQALCGTELAWWPADRGDLGRCEETYRRAPEHLQKRMLPTLERFREHVAKRYHAAPEGREAR